MKEIVLPEIFGVRSTRLAASYSLAPEPYRNFNRASNWTATVADRSMTILYIGWGDHDKPDNFVNHVEQSRHFTRPFYPFILFT